MEDKKMLNDEDLDKVSGGLISYSAEAKRCHKCNSFLEYFDTFTLCDVKYNKLICPQCGTRYDVQVGSIIRND